MIETPNSALCCNSCRSADQIVCGKVNTPMYTRRRSLLIVTTNSFTEREHVCHRSHQSGESPEIEDTG